MRTFLVAVLASLALPSCGGQTTGSQQAPIGGAGFAGSSNGAGGDGTQVTTTGGPIVSTGTGVVGAAGSATPGPTPGPGKPGPPPAPPEGAACWYGQLPAEVQPILPKTTVAQACAGSANASWEHADGGLGGVGYDGDARADIVGRWAACGKGTFSSLPHAGVEFGANGRWRLLTVDASGALVPSTSTPDQAHGRYYALGSGQLNIHDDGFSYGGTFFLKFSSALDAMRFDASDPPSGSSTYARAEPSPANGRDNLPSLTDGRCTMVGTWDVPANTSPPMVPAASFSFDSVGNFVGGPQGSDLCSAHTMYGTYSLSSGLFQLTSNVGLGVCSWWFDAGYPATFDATCTKLTIKQQYDNCTGGRGYFNGETTLTKHP